tara:strand:+ start:1290 stop:2435 length:1146 start_codon:yes stop_codon:yes gene_type:complete
MSNFWSGSADNVISGSTPFGIYDTDSDYQTDGPKIASWCAKRLGYPIVDVELVDLNFYACFEEAVSEYSAQVNQFNIKNNLTSLQGQPTGSNYTQQKIAGNPLPNLIEISDSYGTYANVGGKVDVKKGNIELNSGSQEYDLQSLWADVSESGNRINVTKVFYEATPAINKFFDPYSVSGQGTLNLIDEFGFGSFSPAAQFVLMPIYEDILRIQAIEFNDQIRKSAFTFNLVNNKLQIFPKPVKKSTLYFEYIVKKEFDQSATSVTDGVVADYSNTGYDFHTYSRINDVGKQWIRKYTLALAKELLGAIREKFSSVPIPGSEVSLDGAALRSEAQTEKDALIEQLRDVLNDLSDKERYQSEADQSDAQQRVISKVPLNIYIG